MNTFPARAVLGLMAVLLVAAGRLLACSTPVCQYALANWPADTYDVQISANAGDLDALRKSCALTWSTVGGTEANAAVRFRADAALPALTAQVALRFPNHASDRPPLWAGALSAERLRAIVDSPVRAQLATELLGGAAAVFLFLPGGDTAVDAAARARLQTALAEVSRTLVPPAVADDTPGAAAGAPAAFRFPILEVSREDPDEAFLRALLLASEADLAGLREPLAFPVFGRGRLLYAIAGAGINREVLAEACAFLTGACSCEVKAQNPGVDLLLLADWSRVAGTDDSGFTELPPLTGLSASSPAGTVAPPPEPVVAPAAALVPRSPPLTSRALAVIGAALAAVLAGTLAVLLRSRSR